MMAIDPLTILAEPKLDDGRLVLAFTGWMDGGEVSTGSVGWLIKHLKARAVARIEPDDFYISNFPGSMEVSALFRPHTRIEEGLIQELEYPANRFYCSTRNNLLLFDGKEPNLNWPRFADCVFSYAQRAGVSMLYFVGSYAGAVPHTREPRLTAVVSDESLKVEMSRYGLGFANYEGPASFATHLVTEAGARGLSMATIVAEIPPYVQGRNPRSIEAVLRKMAAVLGLSVDLESLRRSADRWEHKLNEALEEKDDLKKLIAELESDYDSEVFHTQMGDLKDWLERRGIQVD